VNECIEMYQKLFKHEEAIRVAEQNRHPDTVEMRQAYFQYLLETNQEERAAALKVREGDFMQAINLFLKGGMPGKAAQVILENDIQNPVQLLDQVATALTRAGMHDKAGDFYERLNELQRALDSYIRGNAYRKAVELARKCFPGRVVELQEQWGDYLVSQKQIDMAINHYIEAKVYQKAIEAALNARQYSRALQLVDAIDPDSARPYYKQLARYYEDSRQYDLAERCFVSADQPHLAVEMHTKLGHWEVAHKIAMSYMKEGEVGLLYINQAQKLEAKGRLKEAEKLYLSVKEKDLAINMYKKHRRFDDMVRLVQDHRPDLLKETHQFLAQTLEMEGSLKDAEHHYVEAQEWHSAVNMYRSNELWDDAIRVAKFYGGINACKRVTIALLMAIGVVEGAKYLTKHSLVEAAIEYAAENGSFDMAMELATQNMPKKLPELYLKHALFLEDDERFAEAEDKFIKANKPKEAIDMYVHQQDWPSALRVAEGYDPTAIPDVYVAQAKIKAEAGDFKAAEELYLSASRPELALAMYQEADRWSEALNLAKMHRPHRVAEVNTGYQGSQTRKGKGSSKNDYMAVGRSLEQNKQWDQAIDAYLNAKSSLIDSASDLEDIWGRAIEVARNFVPNRHVKVAIEVSKRLVEIKRVEAAADILFEVNRHDEAVTICIENRKYDKAKALAQGNPSLRRRVDEAYQGELVSRGETNELVGLGHSEVALDVLAKKGDWERLWEVAGQEQMSGAVVGKYVIMRVEEVRTKLSYLPLCESHILTLTIFPPCTAHAQEHRGGPGRGREGDQQAQQPRHRVGRGHLPPPGDAPALAHLQGGDRRARGHHLDAPGHPVPPCEPVPLPADRQEAQRRDPGDAHGGALPEHALQRQDHGSEGDRGQVLHHAAQVPQPDPPRQGLLPGGHGVQRAGQHQPFLLAAQPVCFCSIHFCYHSISLMFVSPFCRYVDLTEAIDANDASFLDNTEFQDADAIPLQEALPPKHYLDNEVSDIELRPTAAAASSKKMCVFVTAL